MAVNNRRRALERQMKPKRIIREKEACDRLGCRRTKFRKDYRFNSPVDPFVPGTEIPRLKAIHLGPRNIGFLDGELDQLIGGLAELRDALPATTPPRAATNSTRSPR
jgi:hypothetical protein